MTSLETVKKMLDFQTHIKKIQYHIDVCKKSNEESKEEDLKYWEDCLKEILKIRQNIEVKIAKERSAGNGA